MVDGTSESALIDAFADFIAGVPTRAIETPFGRSSYWEMGEGEPLVLLHGISGGRRLFFRTVPLLAQHYRVIVPALRGEDVPVRGCALDDLMGDIDALLTTLQLDAVTLYGASFGGYLALAYAARNDPRVRAVVTQGAFTRFRLRPLDILSLYGSYAVPSRFGSSYYAWRVLKGRETGYLQEFAPGIDQLNFGWQRATPFASLRQRTHMIAGIDLSDRVRGIEVPVSIGHGRRDPVVPFAAFEQLRTLLPQAAAEAWDAGGHMQMITHPELFSGLAGTGLARGAHK